MKQSRERANPIRGRAVTRWIGLPFAAASLTIGLASPAQAVDVPMRLVTADGVGRTIGTVSATDTAKGVQLTPSLTGLPPGEHGFHLHAKGSCDPAPDPDKGGALAAAFGAGGHFDPATTGKHEGPEGMGHQGDIPFLVVAADGSASKALVAPHLKTSDLAGRALVIHAGGDNYSDQPTKLGGGGGRIACGVVP
jgi:superoxide dismutase, Cu-Zn family